MTVVDKKPVPIYETKCRECHSVIHYKACEVFLQHITCPVCGCSVFALAEFPVAYEENEDDNNT